MAISMRSRSARWWLAVLAGFEVASEGVRAGAVDVRQDTLGATEVLTPTATILSPVTQSDDGPGNPSQTALQPRRRLISQIRSDSSCHRLGPIYTLASLIPKS